MAEVRRLLDATPSGKSALQGLRTPPQPAVPSGSAPAPPPAASAATHSVPVSPTAASLAQPVGLAAGLLAVAGIIHLVLLPQHLEEARGIGLYFCAIGAAQVIWALLYVLRPTRSLAWLGAMGLAVQPVVVYVMTRILRQPFGTGTEPVDLIGIVTGIMELGALLPFAVHLSSTRPTEVSVGRGVAVPLALALVAGLVFGVALYGAGLVAEDLVPWLDEPESPHMHAGHAEADLAQASLVAEPAPDVASQSTSTVAAHHHGQA
ncbi:MAG: hypothetical protein ACYC2H_03025 [Thermoplasmatota archaeon]